MTGTQLVLHGSKQKSLTGQGKETDESDQEDYEMFLMLNIKKASIMNTTTSCSSSSFTPVGLYYVVAWITPTTIAQTPTTVGNPNPIWYWSFHFPIRQSIDTASLKLEVIRVGFFGETGTSTGDIVVGRAQIPISSRPFEKKIDLVQCQGTRLGFPGYIEVDLDFAIRMIPRFHPRFWEPAAPLPAKPSINIVDLTDEEDPPSQDSMQGDRNVRRRKRRERKSGN